MSKLPNAERAIVDERKITGYLLSETHPRGKAKAAYFRRFGFRHDAPEVMLDALVDHAKTAEVVTEAVTQFGHRYIVSGALRTPDGRNPLVITVWELDFGESTPRFVTACPGPR